MKKCKVLIIFVLMILLTGSSFLTYSFNIVSKQGDFFKQIGSETSFDNRFLDYLYVHGYKLEPEFDYTNLDYTVKVPVNTDKLTIGYRLQSVYSSSEIVGNENLKNGSLIKVIVTSGDKKVSSEYNITVVYSNSKLIFKIIIIILIVIILGCAIAGLLYYLNLRGIIHIELKKKEKEKIGEENYVK